MENQYEISLMDILLLFKKHVGTILLAGVLMAALAFGYTALFVTPQYQTSAKMVVLSKSTDISISYADMQVSTQLVKDSAEIINSRTVLEKVINKLNLDIGVGTLSKKIDVSFPTGTRVVKITVTDIDPVRAQQIAYALCEAASERIVEVLSVDAVNTYDQPTVPAAPSSPSLMKNGVIGGFIGVVLAMGIIILLKLINNKVNTAEDIENILGLTVLGAIPLVDEDEQNKSKKNKKPENAPAQQNN